MGGKSATTTQKVTIPPEVMARYNAVNKRAEQAAAQPFQQYSTDPNAFVAPITGTQQAGIQNIGMAQNIAQPYYQAGAGLTLSGSRGVGPLTQQQIGYYENPYTQAVAGTTFDALRQQQQQEMQGATANAIRSGAFGGDRAGLVAANLARQQQLGTAQAMAPIYERGYAQALQTAQGQQGVMAQDLQRQLAAGQQIAGLGTGATQTALQAGQALLGAGTAEQQTQQAGLSALYNQFLQERGYPFQVAQFLANIAMGTGALSGSTTTTQQPVPFFSDEREKTNIQPLGKGLYAYDYIDDVEAAERGERPMPPKRVGPMAQDIEERAPGLVGEVGGHKVVKGLAPESMGGAVIDLGPGEYRAAYANGGMPDFAANLRQLYAQFGGPQGVEMGLGAAMTGGPYGAKIAAPPPAQLKTAAAPPKAPQSMTSEFMKTAEGVRDFGKTASELYESGEKGLGKLADWFGYGKAEGGGVDKDDPMASYGPKGPGIDIPTEQPEIKPLEPAKPPPPPGSVMGDILGLAKTAASIYSGLPFADGGLVPRVGYQAGGSPSFDEALERTLRYEGGYNPNDVGSPTMMGIRQASNPDVDLRRVKEDPEYRSNIYRERYWNPIGADRMDPKLATIAFDTSVNLGPGRTKQLLEEAGNDPIKLLQLRQRHYDNLIARNPEKYGQYGGGWTSRVNDLMAYAGGEPRAEASSAIDRAAGRPAGLAAARGAPAPERSGLSSFLPSRVDPRTGQETTDWKKVIIPALTGLGAMASSPSLYAGSAILQGLGAGAKSYADLEKQQQEIEESKSREATGYANVANIRFMVKDGIPVIAMRDANGNERYIDYGKYRSAGEPPLPTGGRFTSDMERFEYKPAPIKTETAAAGPQAPEAPKAPEAPQQGMPRIDLEQKDLQDAKKWNDVSYSTGTSTLQQYKDVFTPQETLATALTNNRLPFNQLASQLAELPETGALSPGAQTAFTVPIVDAINGILQTIGARTELNKDLSNFQAIQKEITRLASEQSGATDQRAFSALNTFIGSLPTARMTKEGIAKQLATMQVESQVQLDKAEYFRKFKEVAQQSSNREPLRSGSYFNIDARFNERNKPAAYAVAKKNIEKMYLDTVTGPDGKPVLDQRTQRPISVADYVYRYAGRARPEDLKKIEEKYGKGILRYFGA